jgi:N-acetyl sugar amidotransferase
LNRCKKCLMPDTRPRVVFTDGICNACHYHATKPDVDWDDRKAQFLELVKSKKRHPAYDCIVPFSGGKDSAMIAHRLKFELGLNPLLVCYGQMLWTEAGKHNFTAVCNAGFDIQYERVNQDVCRQLARRFFLERGHPKAHYDAGINAAPVIAARDRGIPLIIYAEHGDTEYGGIVLNEDSRRVRDLEEVLENCVGDDARNWATGGISEADLFPYIYPDNIGDTLAVYWSWYMGPWDIYENALYCRDKMGFTQAHKDRTPGPAPWAWGQSDGSFEGFDSIDDMIDDLDFYLMFKKFGFGRATRMASRLIQYGHMSRGTGMAYVEQYDGEFPLTYLPQVLDYLNITEVEFRAAIENHDEGIT